MNRRIPNAFRMISGLDFDQTDCSSVGQFLNVHSRVNETLVNAAAATKQLLVSRG